MSGRVPTSAPTGSAPTVADILALPELQRGDPTLEAARNATDRAVRWVHVSEVADIAHLLMGGELILSTGIALPEAPEDLVRYVADLAAAQASGLVIELGRRFNALPAVLVRAAEAHGLPLVALHTEVAFVTITEAIHSIIVNAQVRQLQMSESIHQTFRALATEASSAQDVVEEVAHLAGCPVVLENLAHHVVAFAVAASTGEDLLRNWEARSREAVAGAHSAVAGRERWLVTHVGARGQVWGRLVLVPEGRRSPQHLTILEQAATTLALHRLIERDQQVLEHQTNGTLLSDIIEHRYASSDSVHVRAQSLGLVTRRRTLLAAVVLTETGTPPPDAVAHHAQATSGVAHHAQAREEVTAIVRALEDAGTPGLAGALEPGRVGVLLALPEGQAPEPALETLSEAVHARLRALSRAGRAVIGAGTAVDDVDGLRHSFAEAKEVAEAAQSLALLRPFATVADIRLRGLVHLLRDDPRVQSFVERELGRLVAHDEQHGTALFDTLVAYLETGGNKSAAAARAHLSRPALYHHLARAAGILGCDLEAPESRASLHMAVLAMEAMRSAGTGGLRRSPAPGGAGPAATGPRRR